MAQPIPTTLAGDYERGEDDDAAYAGVEDEEEEEDELIARYNMRKDEPQQIHKINKDKSHSLEYLLEKRATADRLLQQNIMHGSMLIHSRLVNSFSLTCIC